MKKVNCIIVGSGIAGISMAWELYQHHISFFLMSNPKASSSSVIAPGVWNPIVFKRITPTWNATKLIEMLLPFYRFVEKKINKKIIRNMKLLHVINNKEEENLWYHKQYFYPRFLKNIDNLSNHQFHYLRNNWKCGEVAFCGRLQTSEYIYYSLELFKSIHSFSEQYFNYDALIIDKHQVEYDGVIADKIIFCEGYLIKNNPYFNFVKLKPAKGEIVEVESKYPVMPSDCILHKQLSFIPIDKNRYLIGSNYEWNDLNENLTETIKEKFLSEFESVFNVEYQYVQQYAGIRPSADRRPVLGRHPNVPNMYVLNGLGTKGVMLAPYCAKILTRHILYNKEIEEELNVKRFWI